MTDEPTSPATGLEQSPVVDRRDWPPRERSDDVREQLHRDAGGIGTTSVGNADTSILRDRLPQAGPADPDADAVAGTDAGADAGPDVRRNAPRDPR